MKFMFRRRAAADPRSVLLIQTCNPNLLEYVVRDLLDRLPDSKLTVLLQRNMRSYVIERPGVEYLDNPAQGGRAFASTISARRFDLMAFVLSGEAGYWKLKLLPFICDPIRVLVYNRMAQPRELNLFRAGRVLYDMAGSMSGGARPGPVTGRRALRKLLAPAILTYLALFYWRRNSKRIGR